MATPPWSKGRKKWRAPVVRRGRLRRRRARASCSRAAAGRGAGGSSTRASASPGARAPVLEGLLSGFSRTKFQRLDSAWRRNKASQPCERARFWLYALHLAGGERREGFIQTSGMPVRVGWERRAPRELDAAFLEALREWRRKHSPHWLGRHRGMRPLYQLIAAEAQLTRSFPQGRREVSGSKSPAAPAPLATWGREGSHPPPTVAEEGA